MYINSTAIGIRAHSSRADQLELFIWPAENLALFHASYHHEGRAWNENRRNTCHQIYIKYPWKKINVLKMVIMKRAFDWTYWGTSSPVRMSYFLKYSSQVTGCIQKHWMENSNNIQVQLKMFKYKWKSYGSFVSLMYGQICTVTTNILLLKQGNYRIQLLHYIYRLYSMLFRNESGCFYRKSWFKLSYK